MSESCSGAHMEAAGRYGVGIGWRREIAGFVADLPGAALHRGGRGVAARSGRPVPEPLAALRARGVAVVPHGVRLSLGGAEPVDPARVAHLAHCARVLTHRW